MKILKQIKSWFLKSIKNSEEADIYYLLFFILGPYTIGIPLYFMNTKTANHILIEIFAPWLVGFICMPAIAFIILLFVFAYYLLKEIIYIIIKK